MNCKHIAKATLLVATSVASVPASAASCGSQERELSAIKLERWPGYYRAQDVAGLDRFLAEEFMVVDASGQVSSKADELRWLAANPWSPSDFLYRISSISCPEPGIAVIVGEGRSTRQEGARRVSHRYVSSNVLVRGPSGWRAVLSHISGERRDPAG